MKKNKIAATLIEVMVVILVISIWLIWVYNFFIKSTWFLDWVSSKIEAIEIAREGIEALENIRNTNWIIFSWNLNNCWNVFDYNTNCIINNWTEKIDSTWNWKDYIILNTNWKWNLVRKNVTWTYKDDLYRKTFFVWKDKVTWKYCQNEWWNCVKINWNYIRKINVKSKWLDKMMVTSTVEWKDTSSSTIRKIEIKNLLTNYKK